jgi:hypothetical protein
MEFILGYIAYGKSWNVPIHLTYQIEGGKMIDIGW